MRRRAPLGALLAPLALAAPLAAGAYLDGPPAARTGGFGEPTCRACHFDGPQDDPSVSLSVRGVPERWIPGEAYALEVILAREGLPAGGFQMAARFASGEAAGRQAGGLAPGSDRVAVVDSAGILYAQHTFGGTRPTGAGTARWRVEWTAPETPRAPVVFHVAANAANDDASELGDRIATAEARSAPCEAARGEGDG